jgi:hypothetical protein
MVLLCWQWCYPYGAGISDLSFLRVRNKNVFGAVSQPSKSIVADNPISYALKLVERGKLKAISF